MTCRHCLYRHPRPDGKLECRVQSPQVCYYPVGDKGPADILGHLIDTADGQMHFVSLWPLVGEDDSCGEFMHQL